MANAWSVRAYIVARRRDVEHRDALDGRGMIAARDGGDTAAAVVADQREAVEAEVVHQLDHVAAIARFEYGACAASVGGFDDSP